MLVELWSCLRCVMFVVGVVAMGCGALMFVCRRLNCALLGSKRRSRLTDSMMDVVFLHPDLGLGGAERLVVDAAVGLMSRQQVFPKVRCRMVTSFHDRSRAFPETCDGTLEVVVRGDWFPRHIRNRALVLCATIRMAIAATQTCFSSPRTDVFVVDQVSAVVPLIKLLCPASSVLFYCHFPDQLCDPSKHRADGRSAAHRLYRHVFNWVEESTMDFADSIVCNSIFSRGVTVRTFHRLAQRIDEVEDIFYPPIDVEKITREPSAAPTSSSAVRRGGGGGESANEVASSSPFDNLHEAELRDMLKSRMCMVSLNRYERKKNIGLGLRSFAEALAALRQREDKRHQDIAKKMIFIIAGGYDPRILENVEHHRELMELAQTLHVADHVVFLRSISERIKFFLLRDCRCVVYTPSGEHFGIVPIEAMAFGRVVIAVNDGGPLESVTDSDRFGFLRPPTVDAFAAIMVDVAVDDALVDRVGHAANERCRGVFSLQAFSEKLMRRCLTLRTVVTDCVLGISSGDGVRRRKSE